MLLFCILFLWRTEKESQLCMGIPFITNEEIQNIAFYHQELENIVSMNGYLLPYDKERREIYIPCVVEEGMRFNELEGQLQSALPEYKLYFVWDGFFDVLSEALKYNCRFTIFAVDSQGNFTTFGAVFTTLPVIEIHGEIVRVDERERDIYSGEVTVWNPSYHDSDRLVVQHSLLEWHVRGFSSQSAIKQPLKLNLKDKNGENNNLSMLGFESDDDYLLNSMWFDDIKVREKLAMDLWNEIAEEKNSTLKMSKGEYCELVINDEHMGLRLVQNKIEKSYLKLAADDVLLKGQNVNIGTNKPPEGVYEVIYSKHSEDITYQTISKFFYQTDFSNVNLESWVDLQLLMHLGNMVDNETYKNIYYVIEQSDGKDSLSFIPWDTDMSFGIYWNDGFRYMPETVETITYRMEYEKLRAQYPEIDLMLAERWKELRQGIFTEENIFNKVSEYNVKIHDCGAYKRDFNYLGWHSWGGEDTIENFEAYITRRLQVLDEYYGMN